MTRTDGSPPKAPRWVKVSAFVALVLILVLGALALLGEGDHGPARHQSSGNGGERSIGGHAPPAGAHP